MRCQWRQLITCKLSVPCSRQITMPTPHHSICYKLDALPGVQPKVLSNESKTLLQSMCYGKEGIHIWDVLMQSAH